MSYLVPDTSLVSIFGYNLVNPYPEAIIASQKFALFENRYPQNKNNVSFGYPKLHMSMQKFTSLILYVEYYSTKKQPYLTVQNILFYFIMARYWILVLIYCKPLQIALDVSA